MDYNNEIYRELTDKYKDAKLPTLSEEEKEETINMLATPDMRPLVGENTWEAWLLRISYWGKIKIIYKNPEDNVNKEITRERFLYTITDEEKLNLYGVWHIKYDRVDQVIFYRKFWSIQGKEVTEELIVEVNLRPDMKKAIQKSRTIIRR